MQEVLNKVYEIAQKSLGGSYIFRGESKLNHKVASRLYRDLQNDWKEGWNIENVQANMLREAENFTDEEDHETILTELQHYGGSTNLIDFTTDFLIALYFACDGDPEVDGRLIFFNSRKYETFTPTKLADRVTAQKSIFVRPHRGFIEKEDFECLVIPHHLKEGILEYLQIAHGISVEYIYSDLHGFIRHQRIHQEASDNFHAGFAHLDEKDHCAAIKSYTESISFNPRHDGAFNNRGAAYWDKGDYRSAKRDFSKALEINPKNQYARINQGIAWLTESCWDEAIADFRLYKREGGDVGESFYSEYGSIQAFEQKFNVALPECIVAMIGKRRR